jgi:hypothetical protein
MKSILYVAATLMIGASIYGFVDYKKTNQHKEFKAMYDEPEVKEAVASEEKKTAEVAAPKTVSKKEQGVIAKNEPSKEPAKKIKKKRTINYESFSRAPLREKVEVVVIPEVKEAKDKEQ